MTSLDPSIAVTGGAIVIYGASGTTGGLVAHHLHVRGARVVLAGRDRDRLAALAAELPGAEIRVAAVDDPAALRAAFAGARAVVACAGPFAQIGEPVLEAAIACRAHYLDSSGEQAFARTMYERHDSAARRAGVAAINGMAFEIALGDLAAAWAAAVLDGVAQPTRPVRAEAPGRIATTDPLDEVDVAYVLDGFAPTPGTARSALASLAVPGVVWNRDRWDPVAPAASRRRFHAGALGDRDAVSFPSAEVVTVPRHVAAQRVETFVSVGRSPWPVLAAAVASRVAPLLAAGAGIVADPRTARLLSSASRFLAPHDDEQAGRAAGVVSAVLGRDVPPDVRARARFAVIARVRRRFDLAQVRVSGADIYRVSAIALAWAALALAARRGGPAGVLAPAEVFAPEATLTALTGDAELSIETAFPQR